MGDFAFKSPCTLPNLGITSLLLQGNLVTKLGRKKLSVMMSKESISYEIQVDGVLGERWDRWIFGDLAFSYQSGGVTTILARVPDSAALRGLVNHLWDLNLSIFSIQKIQPDNDQTKMEITMKTEFVLELSNSRARLELVGGKGASLTTLANAGLPVPDGFHVTTAAYQAFVAANQLGGQIAAGLQIADPASPATLETASASIRQAFEGAKIPPEVASEIVEAYATLPGKDPAVAVRSTATAEDLPEASFAGQHETYLNVSGASAVLEAVKKCWGSLWTARSIAYRAGHAIDPENVYMGVVVQLLVHAEAAGILFTANPLNGKRDELVINTSWGLGEAVVGGLVTPDTIIVAKSNGRVLSNETADKQVMTVRHAGGTEEQGVPENLRRVPVLDDEDIAALLALGIQIETLYGTPMDIEWALYDGAFTILQARPITALPEPEASRPLEWKLPEGAYVAMRNNIVELMADPLMPLFATLGLSSVNTSMNNLLFGFFGRRGIVPEEMIITVNEYAYYNGSVRPGPMIRILFDSVGIAKRMFTKPVERWTERGRPQYLAVIEQWENSRWIERSNVELIKGVRALSEAAIDAYGSLVSGVIPAAWITEALFTLTYKRLIKRRNDPAAPIYLLGYDSTPIKAEKSIFDLAQWVWTQPELAAYITGTPAENLAEHFLVGSAPVGISAECWEETVRRFHAHLRQYGHTIYNLDFGNPVPADDPAPTLEVLKMFVNGEGVNPHERQRKSAARRDQVQAAMEARLKGWRLKFFRSRLVQAQRFAPMREDGIADVGLSYPLLRQMALELGRRFSDAGKIARAEDIFWLVEDEVIEAAASLDGGAALVDVASRVEERKATWKNARQASPPLMLPNKILGLDIAKLKEGQARKENGEVLKGVAASPGRVEAPACVIRGPEDFSKMKVGDVLVASITTPAWTPLFARASAVVTDVGGPLSHGSIVAREYGIPAVLGTGSATSRIQSGEIISVDGSAGKVILAAHS